MLVRAVSGGFSEFMACREVVLNRIEAKLNQGKDYYIFMEASEEEAQRQRLAKVQHKLAKAGFEPMEVEIRKIKNQNYGGNYGVRINSFRLRPVGDLRYMYPLIHTILGELRLDKSTLFDLAVEFFTPDAHKKKLLDHKYDYGYNGAVSFFANFVDPRYLLPLAEKYWQEIADYPETTYRLLPMIRWALCGDAGSQNLRERLAGVRCYGHPGRTINNIAYANTASRDGIRVEFWGKAITMIAAPEEVMDRVNFWFK